MHALRSVALRIVIVAAAWMLGGCATHLAKRALRVGDTLEVTPRRGTAGRRSLATVEAATPGRLALRLAHGDTLVLRDNTSYAVRLREGMRGAGVLRKAVGIGLLTGAGPGLLVYAFGSRTTTCDLFFCSSQSSDGAIAAVLGGTVGGVVGVVIGGIAAQMPHWYVVPQPVPPAAGPALPP